MTILVQDRDVAEHLIAERRARGIDLHDEVWEGMYVIMPNPDDEHQECVGSIVTALTIMVQQAGLGKVRPGVNVSDRYTNWKQNYRIPDVAVFLNESSAECHDTFWLGGPDFAVEIASPDDRAAEKLAFYAAVGTRELLLIDRDPWRLELYRLRGDALESVGQTMAGGATPLVSEVPPLSWRLISGNARPQIEILHSDGRQWTV